MRRWQILKLLWRSRSLSFTINTVRGITSNSLRKIRWRGHDIFYRPGTSDSLVIYQVLLRSGNKAEYYVPPALDPKVIVDIGSNIGASILSFHRQFPSAKIFGFEPHPETFKILQSNVGQIPSVSVFNYALGAEDAVVSVPFEGIDFSGFTTKIGAADSTGIAMTHCEIRNVGAALNDLGVSEVDLMKIDCEGAEYEILTALPREILKRCNWIVGELHDSSGFKLLELLSADFDLDLKKRMFAPFFRFHACNFAAAPKLKGTFDRSALQA
jgi:FkbM family methyltransferase